MENGPNAVESVARTEVLINAYHYQSIGVTARAIHSALHISLMADL